MEGAGDIGVVSIPFAAGTAAAAALVPAVLSAGWLTQAAGLALALCAGIISAGTLLRWSRAALAALFLACGLFCGLSYSMIPVSEGWGPALRSVEGLRALITSIPFPHTDTADILTALLTGDRSGISRDVTSVFRDSGASHILALSGLHLGVIYILIRRMTWCMGQSHTARILRSALVTASCGFYALMTGAGPSIIRAWLFIVLREAGSLMPGRRLEGGRTLATALMLQLALTPTVITSLGFQLSYLAMCGIVILYPRMESWYPDDGPAAFRKADPMRKIWSGAALSISCQAFTAPLVWITFHSFPKFFLITNLIALPLTSAVIVTSVAVTVLYAAGFCPVILTDAADALVQVLVHVLTIISSL